MITNDYLVKIVDFGMAKKVNAAYVPQSDSNLVGTLPYMVYILIYLLSYLNICL